MISKCYDLDTLNRHLPVKDQHKALNAKMRGHYQYYGVTGNNERLDQFYRAVLWRWRFWLNRRSNDARMTWQKFYRLKDRYPLIRPFIAHPAPVR